MQADCHPNFDIWLTISLLCVIIIPLTSFETGVPPMLLRPHHLLCLQNFSGHGYNPAFTWHLSGMLHTLHMNPETAVTLVCGCDDLCKACPHHQNGVCRSAAKTAKLDADVLTAAGLSADDSGTWASFAAAARSILHGAAFHQICACCEWYPLCRRNGG